MRACCSSAPDGSIRIPWRIFGATDCFPSSDRSAAIETLTSVILAH